MKEHNLEAFYKYYSNATKEQAIEDMFLDNCNLQEEIERLKNQLQQRDNIIKEVRELAIIKKARVENEPDYSKSYLEGYEVAIQTQHLSHSGVMLETIKSTIKTTCDDFLEILDKENK